MASIFMGLGTIAALLLIVVPIGLWYGFAASILWGWFVVPIFGLPALSVLQCWCITITLGMFRPKIDTSKTDPEAFLSGLGGVILGPPFALAIGYAIKNWWM